MQRYSLNAEHPESEAMDCDCEGEWVRYDDLPEATNTTQGSPSNSSDLVMLPSRLTAENGAKALLMGEFAERVVIDCECCGDDDDCPNCHGEGEWIQPVNVSWTTIKDIYAKVVEHFGA